MIDFPIELLFETVFKTLNGNWPKEREALGASGWDYVLFGLQKDPLYNLSRFSNCKIQILKRPELKQDLLVKIDFAIEKGRVEAPLLIEMIQEEEWWPVPGILFVKKWRKEMTQWYINIYEEKMKE